MQGIGVNIRINILALISLFSCNSFADVYFHVGGGIDYLRHDKSEKDYPILNIKGGVGYQLTPKFSIEFDATAKSTSKYDGTGTCTTNIGTQVKCTRNEEVKRFMVIGSGVYTHELGFSKLFVKAGLGFVKSSFRSAYDSDTVTSLVLADESHNGFSGVVSAGLIRSDKHRIGAVMSTKYGNSTIDDFNFFGIEYNYLFSF